MMTVHEVSKLSGVSIRTLQYYDNIGLLKPSAYTEAGYRLYDNASLERLQVILLFRELEFPLKDIQKIVENPDFDKEKALEQQIELLTLKKEHIDALIKLARDTKKSLHKTGDTMIMDFTAFDKKKIDEYTRRAKESWGHTSAYKEYEAKSKNKSTEDMVKISNDMMKIFTELGAMKHLAPESPEVQSLIKRLQDFITEHYYNCTKEILLSLGKAYSAGGEMTENIDKAGGTGTGDFADKAIQVYCS